MAAHDSIGVFDSGIGGLSVLKALRAELPAEDFVYFADNAHAPYGERSEAYVIERSRAVARQLIEDHGIKALVVACNTATAAAIHLLRAEHPELPVIGVEPALKPAVAASRTKRIGVLATRGTLASEKFRLLHESLKGQAEFILQPCDGLADAIENDDAPRISQLCAQYTRALGPLGAEAAGADVLVLGCTHYPFASQVLAAACGPGVLLVETGVPVARQVRRLLEAGSALATGRDGNIRLMGTGSTDRLHAAADRWILAL